MKVDKRARVWLAAFGVAAVANLLVLLLAHRLWPEAQPDPAPPDAGVEPPEPESMAVTISLGVATIPDSADDLESLVDAADRALLRAKRAGKNQIRAASATRSQPFRIGRSSRLARPPQDANAHAPAAHWIVDFGLQSAAR